jgi:sugar lactone lactonase YvrE
MLERFATLVEGLDHPEGVTSGPDGTPYAGGEAGQIYRIDDGIATEIASTGGFLYGVTIDADGNAYGCDFGRAEVVRVRPDGEVASYSGGTEDRPMRVPNFAAFDDAGALYVTDSGDWRADEGVVYRVAPDGRTEIWTDEPVAFPNGCCLTADGDALLVVETTRSRIVRIPIRGDGSREPSRAWSTSTARSRTAWPWLPMARCSSGAGDPIVSGGSRRAPHRRSSPTTPTGSRSTNRPTWRSSATGSTGSPCPAWADGRSSPRTSA